MFDILDILKNKSVVTYFQPIVSLRHKKIVALEALSRGVACDNTLISPLTLIEKADQKNVSLELDRLFRGKAFETYKTTLQLEGNLLFINVDTKILDNENLELGWTYNTAKSLGLNPKNIVIEICESKVKNTKKLINFVENYRKYGFLIAIDDFGDEHSNLERITIIKPDIIKISRSLVDGIFYDFYKESIIKSIIQLSKSVGATSIAEGVEDKLDVMKCFELGIDLFQGFYFAKPSSCCVEDSENCMNKIYQTLFKISDYVKEYIDKKSLKINEFIGKNNQIKNDLISLSNQGIIDYLENLSKQEKTIDSISLYNLNTNISYDFSSCNNVKLNKEIFKNSCNNASSILKNNIDFISYNDIAIYISDDFMSFLNKNICKTISTRFLNIDNEKYYLCINFILKFDNPPNKSFDSSLHLNSA